MTITIGTMDAYLAQPAAPGRYPGVIVAHQLFGVTEDVRAAADRIAALGYVVIAPSFFHRSQRAVELPVSDEGRSRGFQLMGELTREGVRADVAAVQSFLNDRDDTTSKTGIVGLSMGGHLAYYAATQLDLQVAIVLYGGWLTSTDMPVSRPEPTIELTGSIKGRLVYIVGDADHVVTASQRSAIEARLTACGVSHDMVVLPGAPHAFLADETSPYAARAWKIIEEELAALR